jgi:hypothetical protein
VTKWQQAQNKNQEDRIKLLRDEYNLLNGGGGTGAPTSTATNNPPPDELPDGTEFNVNGVPHVKVNGKPVPVSHVEALKGERITAEQGVFGNIADTVLSPFRAIGNASQELADQSMITFVKNAFERGSFRPEDKRAAKLVLEMPREKTGLTDKQYDLLGKLDGLKTGGK